MAGATPFHLTPMDESLQTRRLDAIRRTFPEARQLAITSAATTEYNCIAWALGETDRCWWPGGYGCYWPVGVMAAVTREAFRWCFAGRGYQPCDDGGLVEGVEKLCLYEKAATPTHAARQLPSGRWTSKLGPDEDVEHDLNDLCGRRYGRPVAFFARPRAR